MITDAKDDSSTLIITGSVAPEFRCTTAGGSVVDSKYMRGKIVMLNFFAVWCPPCKLELPVLQKYIWEKHRDNDEFMLLVIGREHDDKTVRDFAAEKGYTMPFVADPDRSIYGLFATQYIPRNVVIDRDGTVVFQNRSYNAREFKLIEDLIEEKLRKK